MNDGYAFASIESDAYTNLGSSGGGLFNERGDLIGINTWVDIGTPQQRSIAIRLSTLDDIEAFYYCEEVYNGPGTLAWTNCGNPQKNGQSPISVSKLRKLMKDVPPEQRLPRSA